jgi:hypothetical protein
LIFSPKKFVSPNLFVSISKKTPTLIQSIQQQQQQQKPYLKRIKTWEKDTTQYNTKKLSYTEGLKDNLCEKIF